MSTFALRKVGLGAAALTASTLTAWPHHARAEGRDAPFASLPAMPATGLELTRPETSWPEGRVRPFVATSLDAGYLYVRPSAAVGYGRPYWHWVGLETSPAVSGAAFAHYGGMRAALPGLELRAGGRYVSAFHRSFLAPRASYARRDIAPADGPESRYVSLEAEAVSNVRAGPGEILLLGTAHHLLGVDRGYHVFDETLRVAAEPPWLWRARLGYAFPLTSDRLFRIAPTAEVVGIPGRGAYILRGGFVASATFSDAVDLLATFMPVLVSPDSAGLGGADFAQLGVRFRWASGAGE